MLPALVKGNIPKLDGNDIICLNTPGLGTFAVWQFPDENEIIPIDELFDLDSKVLLTAGKEHVHRKSNHPPVTTKNIPAGINKRLSSLSSDKASFDQAAPPYQKALNLSGYHYTLQYEPTKASKQKNRQHNNILRYNPPFSKNTSTNIGHQFLALVDKHFPKNHKLRKIFNQNTIKVSYSCMNNKKK